MIVSLTTYSKRLYHVYLAIESIFNQSYKPNKVVLWLSKDLENQPLPETLLKQQKRGLEINFCEDIKSYKKLIPSLEKYPDDYIVTIDDDAIYHFDMLENFVKATRVRPGYIYANRVSKITLKDGKVMPYPKWQGEYQEEIGPSPLFFPTGIGGVMYFPHSLHSEVLNREVFMDICPYADDVWFYCMALLNGTQVSNLELLHELYYYDNPENNSISPLTRFNVKMNLNDVQMTAVFQKYGLMQKLESALKV